MHWFSINDHVDSISEISKKHYQYLQENVCPQKKTVFFSLIYSWYTSEILVCGQFMTVLGHKWYLRVTKMTAIENSCMQTSMYGNLVYKQYMTKNKQCKILQQYFLLCWMLLGSNVWELTLETGAESITANWQHVAVIPVPFASSLLSSKPESISKPTLKSV